ncbi:hypothetical protein GCM10023314_02520 [Algibacter agarivorans]|uniref:MFS transporter n=1 Tax=Algibacter agarivorans TaxID=1109741 RepID=A0ABP9G9W5_9FLAO
MLGILVIFFIGKYYYELAQDYYRNRWLYGLLGIGLYYAGSAVGGAVVAVADELFDLSVNWDSLFSLSIIAISFGISFPGLFYIVLKRQWEKSVLVIKDEINDIGKHIEDDNYTNSALK